MSVQCPETLCAYAYLCQFILVFPPCFSSVNDGLTQQAKYLISFTGDTFQVCSRSSFPAHCFTHIVRVMFSSFHVMSKHNCEILGVCLYRKVVS